MAFICGDVPVKLIYKSYKVFKQSTNKLCLTPICTTKTVSLTET